MEFSRDSEHYKELAEEFSIGPYARYFYSLSERDKKNLAIILTNQMYYVQVSPPSINLDEVLEYTCEEFLKLVEAFPEKVIALPCVLAEFKYTEGGVLKNLVVEGKVKRKGGLELVESLTPVSLQNPKDFKIFVLLLWRMEKDEWQGQTTFVKED